MPPATPAMAAPAMALQASSSPNTGVTFRANDMPIPVDSPKISGKRQFRVRGVCSGVFVMTHHFLARRFDGEGAVATLGRLGLPL
jgi:hypothetical protein